MAFASKGFIKQGNSKANELIRSLQKISLDGKYPVLFDMSPCLYRMKEYIESTGLKSQISIFDPVEFTLQFLMDRLEFHKVPGTVALHATCSMIKLGLEEKIKVLAEACAEKVIVPENIGCCGFAGDRGFTFPELNQSALRNLKSSLPLDCKEGYSTSRTCEIGLSNQSGIHYKSIMYLVDRSTSARKKS